VTGWRCCTSIIGSIGTAGKDSSATSVFPAGGSRCIAALANADTSQIAGLEMRVHTVRKPIPDRIRSGARTGSLGKGRHWSESAACSWSWNCGSRTCKPNSVRNMNAAGRSFLWATHYCGAQATYPKVVARRAGTRSRRTRRFAGNPFLFGLAPCGVCPARCITAAAVRSYRTFSPLPEPCGPAGIFSVALSVQPA
jgi:hypothetical protein